MKRFLPLLITFVAFSSCQEDLKSNNPGFQGQLNDVFWRANDVRAYVSENGNLRIEALADYETVTLNTSSTNVGTYVLGTTNVNNLASYSSNFSGVNQEYGTIALTGPVSSVAIISGGTGYVSDCNLPAGQTTYTCSSSHETTSSSGGGSGLKVALVASAGVVTSIIRVTSEGNGYSPGDIVTVALGGVNCKLKILNTQNSNGEIKITNYDSVNGTVTGTFKFNAARTNGSTFGSPILNFQYGEFYKVPIYPSI